MAPPRSRKQTRLESTSLVAQGSSTRVARGTWPVSAGLRTNGVHDLGDALGASSQRFRMACAPTSKLICEVGGVAQVAESGRGGRWHSELASPSLSGCRASPQARQRAGQILCEATRTTLDQSANLYIRNSSNVQLAECSGRYSCRNDLAGG